MKSKRRSDAGIPDRARCGDDLLARIEEMGNKSLAGSSDGNGYMELLRACASEIVRLRGELLGIAYKIEDRENRRKYQLHTSTK